MIILCIIAWVVIIRLDERQGWFCIILAAALLIIKLILQFLFTLCKPIVGLVISIVLTLGVIAFFCELTAWEDDAWLEDNQDTAWILVAAHCAIIAMYLADSVLYLLFGLCAKANPDEQEPAKPQ